MLDLTKGYHQMRLDEKSKEITAFTTPEGLFQWLVLPMGMKTAGAVFQHLMDKVFWGSCNQDVQWYTLTI